MSNESEIERSESEIEDINEDERIEIRRKISNLSFEDLLKLKDEMGSKQYNETVLGVSKQKTNNLKRANKNRPREISSKIKPKVLRKELNLNKDIACKKKNAPRDPRFDPLCGQFDSKNFRENYKFVTDIRITEKKELEKELKTCSDPERKQTIKYLLQRTENQIREEEKKKKEEQKVWEEKKEIKDKLRKGETPVFKKKSIRKLESLIEKYEDLKKTNRLQKHIQKRNKKLSVRDKKRNVQNM